LTWAQIGFTVKCLKKYINTAILQLNRWFSSNRLLLNLEKNLYYAIFN
jgi:hypothetical protein